MPETETSLEVRRASDVAAIITVRGELTGASDAALMGAYGQAADPSTRVVIFDFSELEYMNSTGIGLLVTLLVRAGIPDKVDPALRRPGRLDQVVTID